MEEEGASSGSDGDFREEALLSGRRDARSSFARRAAVAGAITALSVFSLMAYAAVGGRGEDDENFPPGLATTDSLDALMELTSSQQYSDMLDAVNAERQKHGLSDLCYSEKMNEAARVHSHDMAAHKRMSHTGSDGSRPSQRITKAGYNWRQVAENVAAGQPSVSSVMDSWMNSPGHRANILKSGISHFGFAVKDKYWTQVFGSPLGDEACMLVGGGEDGHGGQCRDIVPKGEKHWHDADGKGYHCDWYAQGSRCKEHGHNPKYKNFGYTANQACCVCGGGGGGEQKAGCMDKTGKGLQEWHDSDGKEYHCDWYGEKDRCKKHGDEYANGGLTANQACCVCGGGSNLADPPPEGGPTPAPPPPPNAGGLCCNKQCQSSSDCQQPNLFCCPFHHLCMDRSTKSTVGPNCNSCN